MSDLGLLGPPSGCQKIFFKNVFSSVTRYHGQLSRTILEKTTDPILRKVSDREMEGLTDQQEARQMGERDFIGSSPTNVEHPIINNFVK